MSQTRATMLGHCSYVFIHRMAHQLRWSGDYQLSVINLNRPGNEDGMADTSAFDALYDMPNLGGLDLDVQFDQDAGLLRIADKGSGSELASFDPGLYSQKYNLADLNDVVVSDLTARLYAGIVSDDDICQMFYLDPRWISAFRYLPSHTAKIMSIMGSDLFRENGLDVYHKHLEALEQADFITIHTVEMREILLAKYGRHLAPKVRLALYGLAPDLLDEIAAQREGGAAKFRTDHGLEDDRLVVSVGYSAARRQQHVEILRGLSQLPDHIRRRIAAFVPMTYNVEDSYNDEVAASAKAFDIDCRLLTDYMDDGELARFRLATQLMVQVTDTDAFSSSMLETIYGGGIVVAGSWLPYGRIVRDGFNLHAIDDLGQLSSRVQEIIDNWPAEQAQAAASASRVNELYRQDVTIRAWQDVYEEAAELAARRRQISEPAVAVG